MENDAVCCKCGEDAESWKDCIECEEFYQEWMPYCEDCWKNHIHNDR